MTAPTPSPAQPSDTSPTASLYVSGSWGRGEGRRASDLEVLAIRTPSDTPARIHAAYTHLLDTTGLRPDARGVTPTSALFARSLDEWSEAIETWIHHPTENKALPFLGLVMDAVPTEQGPPAGDYRLAAPGPGAEHPARSTVFTHRRPSPLHEVIASHLSAAHQQRDVMNRLLKAMLADWLAHKSVNLSRIRQALGGRMFVDLKRDVLAPIVTLARIHAVAGDGYAEPRMHDPAQWAGPATVWRLGGGDALQMMSTSEAEFLQQAYPELVQWADECGTDLTLHLSTAAAPRQELLRETTRVLRGIQKKASYVYTTLSEYA